MLVLVRYVGRPLQGVECRLVDDNENNVTVADTPGELRVKVCMSQSAVIAGMCYYLKRDCQCSVL